MNRFLMLTLLFFFSMAGSVAMAQSERAQDRNESVESAKVAFLTDKMSLTPEQAQKFWPLYKEYETKRREIFHASRSGHKRKVEEMSEQEAKAYVESIFDQRHKELELEQEYVAKYQRVISTRQIVQFYRGEREFTKLLLKKLDNKQPNQ